MSGGRLGIGRPRGLLFGEPFLKNLSIMSLGIFFVLQNIP